MDWLPIIFAGIAAIMTVVIVSDLWLALRIKAFRRSRHQLFTVRRASRPITYWFLVVGHIAMIISFTWLVCTTALKIVENLK